LPTGRPDVGFWDASAVVPLCLHVPSAGTLRRLVRTHGRLVVWWGTPVEAASAFARLAREGTIGPDGWRQALRKLDALRRTWVEVLPTEHVRDIAETFPERFGLRASDAFQLAAATVWSRGRPRNRPFVCGDSRLAGAAGVLGFSTVIV
jgi:predicted nucleic acid-binding protein